MAECCGEVGGQRQTTLQSGREVTFYWPRSNEYREGPRRESWPMFTRNGRPEYEDHRVTGRLDSFSLLFLAHRFWQLSTEPPRTSRGSVSRTNKMQQSCAWRRDTPTESFSEF
eukprot:759709-Hanusia_phi.AAC.4